MEIKQKIEAESNKNCKTKSWIGNMWEKWNMCMNKEPKYGGNKENEFGKQKNLQNQERNEITGWKENMTLKPWKKESEFDVRKLDFLEL